jgi:hypothetical protein
MLRSVLFTLGLGIVFFGVERYIAPAWLSPDWRLMLGFFLSTSYLNDRLRAAARTAQPDTQVTLTLAATVLRLILALAFLAVMLVRHVANPGAFAGNFLLLYMSYVGFDIWTNGATLRRDS